MSRLTHKEFDQFAHELGSLVRSGLPLPEALLSLSKQLPQGRLQQLAEETAQATERGVPLSEALGAGSVKMPSEFIALVQCGEINGDMNSILQYVTAHSRRVGKFRTSMVTTLTYTLLILLVSAAILVFVANFVIPNFERIFQDLGAELPILTQYIITIGFVLKGPFGVFTLACIVVLIFLTVANTQFKESLLSRVAEMPGFSKLAMSGDTSLYTRFLAEMLPKGVPLPVALRAAALAVSLRNTRKSLVAMSQAVESGQESFKYLAPQTPATAAFLYRQGEKNGRLGEACSVISEYCEERFERIGRQSIAILEPLMILIVALTLGIMVIALYLPLFSIPKLVR